MRQLGLVHALEAEAAEELRLVGEREDLRQPQGPRLLEAVLDEGPTDAAAARLRVDGEGADLGEVLERRVDALGLTDRYAYDSAYRLIESRYDDAAREFLESYRLSRRPELLYNIGSAADRLQRDRELDARRQFEPLGA